jgi:hypothetical protein
MGLFISSISSSTNMVTYLILIVLFVQIIFSGAIFDLNDKPIEAVSYLTTTRWTLVALGTTSDVNGLAENSISCGTLPIDDPTTPEDERNEPQCRHTPLIPLIDYGDNFGDLLAVWVVLGVFGAAFTGMTFVALARTR